MLVKKKTKKNNIWILIMGSECCTHEQLSKILLAVIARLGNSNNGKLLKHVGNFSGMLCSFKEALQHLRSTSKTSGDLLTILIYLKMIMKTAEPDGLIWSSL